MSGASASDDPHVLESIGRRSEDVVSFIRLMDDLIPSVTISHCRTDACGSLTYSGWRIGHLNEHALAMFGAQSDDELKGEPLERLVTMEDARIVTSIIKATLAGTCKGPVQVTVRTMAGDTFPVRMTACDAGAGGIRLVLATLEQPHGTRSRLRASEGRYRQLFNQMPIALMRIDAFGTLSIFEKPRREGVTDLATYLDAHPYEVERALDLVRIAEANDYAESLFGTGEPRSMLTSVRAYWEARPDTFRRMLCARYSGRRFIVEKTVVCGLSGQRVPVFLSQAFPPRSQPQGNSLLGMIDISAQIEAESELQRMRARLADSTRASVTSELAASIAHEVSQPLSSIVVNGGTALRWLDKSPPDLERAISRLKSVINHAERAIDVVNGLRDLSSGVSIEHVSLDANDLVAGALTLIEDEAKAKGIELHAELVRPLPAVEGIHVQLTQVIVNILMNAIQAIDQGNAERRAVHVQTSPAMDGTVEIRIVDTGPGISEDRHSRIFDSFFTTKQCGIGMGLAICRSIVESHGGSIGVGRAISGGAQLTVRLPAIVVEENASPSQTK